MTSKKKILILGSTGMLGYQLFNFFNKKNYTVRGVCRKNKYISNKFIKNKKFINLDLQNFSKLETAINNYRPDHVINCAGIIKQKFNKYEKKNIFLINSTLPNFLSILSKKLSFKFIHISTDCVYDGKKGNYIETTPPNSFDDYGFSKSLGEINFKNCITLRTSIIGHELFQKNGLLEWFLCQKKIFGFKNAFFTGLTTLELSNVILKVLKVKLKMGIYNVASNKISKYELLMLINQIYDRNVKILPNSKFRIDRSLNGRKFEKNYKIKISSWEKMIKEMKIDYHLNRKLYENI